MVEVLVLSKKDLQQSLTMKNTIGVVEEAFKGLALGEVVMPPSAFIAVPKHKGEWVVKSALINNLDVFGVKMSCGYFENPQKHNLPSVMGVVAIADSKTGAPLAIMDGGMITGYRTGAVAGIAARHLARKNSKIAAICGAGNQGRTQLMGLNEVLKLKEARVYDIIPERSKAYAKEMGSQLGLDVKAVDSPAKALKGADVVSTATPSNTPYIRAEWVELGVHVTTIGSDVKGKQELETAIYAKAKVVVDKRDVAVAKGYIKPDQIHAELGEVAAGLKAGRTSDKEITVMDASGLGLQDVTAALAVYRLAKEKGLGTKVELV